MSAEATLNSTTPTQEVTTKQIGPYSFRYGPRRRVAGWFLHEMTTGDYLSLPDESAVEWYLSQLEAKYGTPSVIALPAPQIAGLLPARCESTARTGREIHTANLRAQRDLMAQYPEAETPNQAATLRMQAFLASQPKGLTLTEREQKVIGSAVQQ